MMYSYQNNNWKRINQYFAYFICETYDCTWPTQYFVLSKTLDRATFICFQYNSFLISPLFLVLFQSVVIRRSHTRSNIIKAGKRVQEAR